MEKNLTPIEIRVLGCLVEKELATPDYYPLSLNALANACNQKSNREPVMQLSETEVMQALDSLRHRGYARLSGEGGRVAKFGHNLEAKLFLDRPELAVLAELLLRGPQTVGELRSRAGRMHPFSSMEEVESALQELADRDEPLIIRLPRQPGRKESRFGQLLDGPFETLEMAGPFPQNSQGSPAGKDENRIDLLAREIELLREEVETIRRELSEFRNQFD